eukprot:scaffold139220_cov84-Phaeocystis_antarctica.AAC.1
MTPLLTSGDIMLSGKTFSRPNPNPALALALTLTPSPQPLIPTPGKTFSRPDTGHQWFDELTVSTKGKTVLDVTTVHGRTQVKLDDKVVTAKSVPAGGKVCQHDSSLPTCCPSSPLAPCAHSLLASWRAAQRKRRGY